MCRLLGGLVLDEEDLRFVVDRTLCDHLGADIESIGFLGEHIDGSLVLHWGNIGNDLGLAGGRSGCIDEHNAIVLLGPAHVHIAHDLLLIMILGCGMQIEMLGDLGGLEVGQMADVRLLFLVVDGGSRMDAGQADVIVDNDTTVAVAAALVAAAAADAAADAIAIACGVGDLGGGYKASGTGCVGGLTHRGNRVVIGVARCGGLIRGACGDHRRVDHIIVLSNLIAIGLATKIGTCSCHSQAGQELRRKSKRSN